MKFVSLTITPFSQVSHMHTNLIAGAQENQYHNPMEQSNKNITGPGMLNSQISSGDISGSSLQSQGIISQFSMQPIYQQQTGYTQPQYYLYPQNGSFIQQPMQPIQSMQYNPQMQPPVYQNMQIYGRIDSKGPNDISLFNQSMPVQHGNVSILTESAKRKVSPNDEVSFVENIFLFCWAFVSNVKEFIIENAVDLYEHMFSAQTSKKLELIRRKQRRRAFFKRIQLEMGIPMKKRNSKKLALNLSAISNKSAGEDIQDDLRGGNKLEALEQELMFLKQQLTLAQPINSKSDARRTSNISTTEIDKDLSAKKKKLRKSTKKITNVFDKENHPIFDSPIRSSESTSRSSMTKSPLTQSPLTQSLHTQKQPQTTQLGSIPPPPPLPLNLSIPLASKVDASNPTPSKTTTTTKPLPLSEKSVNNAPPALPANFADLLKQKQNTLRKTSHLQKQPVKKAKEPQFAFHHELFAAIQKKFKNMHENNSLPTNDSESESDSELDDGWTPPKQRTVEKNPLRH